MKVDNERIDLEIEQAKQDEVYSFIRSDILKSLLYYRYYGIEPGGFLTAVLCNNLKEAIGRADQHNARTLKEIVTYVYMKLPASCWGSEDKVNTWLESFER